MNYMREHAGGKYYVLLFLTNALCLRITQAARLEAKHFKLQQKKVWVAPFKKHVGI